MNRRLRKLKTSQLSYKSDSEAVQRYKHALSSQDISYEDRYKIMDMMRNKYSKTSLKNRCSIDGRSRGFKRLTGLSRVKFREFANSLFLPGFSKDSKRKY
jgi:small subunit ribosomal protein S14